MFEISHEEKVRIEHEAVHKILSGLLDGEALENLWLEFDAHETKEAMFAYECDKLECDLQSKLYDEEGCVNLTNQSDNKAFKSELVQKLLNGGTLLVKCGLSLDKLFILMMIILKPFRIMHLHTK